jgi:hypothetical protein
MNVGVVAYKADGEDPTQRLLLPIFFLLKIREDDINTDVKCVQCDGKNEIHLIQDIDQQKPLVNTATNVRVPCE